MGPVLSCAALVQDFRPIVQLGLLLSPSIPEGTSGHPGRFMTAST